MMRVLALGAMLFALTGFMAYRFSRGAAEIVAVETEFAKAVATGGFKSAFLRYIADDGVIFAPDPVPGKEYLQGMPELEIGLEWVPAFVGISAGSDLAFSTGPFVRKMDGKESYGYYLSIWRRQADGTWRYLVDRGVPLDSRPVLPSPSAAKVLTGAWPAQTKIGANQALMEIAEIEKEISAGLSSGDHHALIARFADRVHLMRAGALPVQGLPAARLKLANEGAIVIGARLLAGASREGDFAYTCHAASWSNQGVSEDGHSIRIWQRQRSGWRIIVDEIVPKRARS